MRLALMTDAHLVSPDDPYKGLHAHRRKYAEAWPSFAALIDQVNRQAPDLTVFLGDLVDWLSLANIDFALDLMSKIKSPWEMTLGNHDLDRPDGDTTQLDTYKTKPDAESVAAWKAAGVLFGSRVIDSGDCGILIADSPFNGLTDRAVGWLDRVLENQPVNVLLTHTPLDTPAMRRHVSQVKPAADLTKSVMSESADLYQQVLRGRLAHTFCGHLHTPSELALEQTRCHLLGMAISPNDDKKRQATATIVDVDGDQIYCKQITAA